MNSFYRIYVVLSTVLVLETLALPPYSYQGYQNQWGRINGQNQMQPLYKASSQKGQGYLNNQPSQTWGTVNNGEYQQGLNDVPANSRFRSPYSSPLALSSTNNYKPPINPDSYQLKVLPSQTQPVNKEPTDNLSYKARKIALLTLPDGRTVAPPIIGGKPKLKYIYHPGATNNDNDAATDDVLKVSKKEILNLENILLESPKLSEKDNSEDTQQNSELSSRTGPIAEYGFTNRGAQSQFRRYHKNYPQYKNEEVGETSINDASGTSSIQTRYQRAGPPDTSFNDASGKAPTGDENQRDRPRGSSYNGASGISAIRTGYQRDGPYETSLNDAPGSFPRVRYQRNRTDDTSVNDASGKAPTGEGYQRDRPRGPSYNGASGISAIRTGYQRDGPYETSLNDASGNSPITGYQRDGPHETSFDDASGSSSIGTEYNRNRPDETSVNDALETSLVGTGYQRDAPQRPSYNDASNNPLIGTGYQRDGPYETSLNDAPGSFPRIRYQRGGPHQTSFDDASGSSSIGTEYNRNRPDETSVNDALETSLVGTGYQRDAPQRPSYNDAFNNPLIGTRYQRDGPYETSLNDASGNSPITGYQRDGPHETSFDDASGSSSIGTEYNRNRPDETSVNDALETSLVGTGYQRDAPQRPSYNDAFNNPLIGTRYQRDGPYETSLNDASGNSPITGYQRDGPHETSFDDASGSSSIGTEYKRNRADETSVNDALETSLVGTGYQRDAPQRPSYNDASNNPLIGTGYQRDGPYETSLNDAPGSFPRIRYQRGGPHQTSFDDASGSSSIGTEYNRNRPDETSVNDALETSLVGTGYQRDAPQRPSYNDAFNNPLIGTRYQRDGPEGPSYNNDSGSSSSSTVNQGVEDLQSYPHSYRNEGGSFSQLESSSGTDAAPGAAFGSNEDLNRGGGNGESYRRNYRYNDRVYLRQGVVKPATSPVTESRNQYIDNYEDGSSGTTDYDLNDKNQGGPTSQKRYSFSAVVADSATGLSSDGDLNGAENNSKSDDQNYGNNSGVSTELPVNDYPGYNTDKFYTSNNYLRDNRNQGQEINNEGTSEGEDTANTSGDTKNQDKVSNILKHYVNKDDGLDNRHHGSIYTYIHKRHQKPKHSPNTSKTAPATSSSYLQNSPSSKPHTSLHLHGGPAKFQLKNSNNTYPQSTDLDTTSSPPLDQYWTFLYPHKHPRRHHGSHTHKVPLNGGPDKFHSKTSNNTHPQSSDSDTPNLDYETFKQPHPPADDESNDFKNPLENINDSQKENARVDDIEFTKVDEFSEDTSVIDISSNNYDHNDDDFYDNSSYEKDSDNITHPGKSRKGPISSGKAPIKHTTESRDDDDELGTGEDEGHLKPRPISSSGPSHKQKQKQKATDIHSVSPKDSAGGKSNSGTDVKKGKTTIHTKKVLKYSRNSDESDSETNSAGSYESDEDQDETHTVTIVKKKKVASHKKEVLTKTQYSDVSSEEVNTENVDSTEGSSSNAYAQTSAASVTKATDTETTETTTSGTKTSGTKSSGSKTSVTKTSDTKTTGNTNSYSKNQLSASESPASTYNTEEYADYSHFSGPLGILFKILGTVEKLLNNCDEGD